MKPQTMAVCRKMRGLCALMLAFVDLFVAFLLLWLAALTFCFHTVIGPFNSFLIRFEVFLLDHYTRKMSTVHRTICRLLQFEGGSLEPGMSRRHELIEGEFCHGPSMSRRESTLSTYSVAGDVSSLFNNSEATEKTEVNLEDENPSVSTRTLKKALKEEKAAHAKLKRELEAEKRELEAERRAAETAAFETMAKIALLQEEKANIEREARQYQIEGGKSKYKDDQIENLEEKLIERDRQVYIMEKENEAYREILKERGLTLNSSFETVVELGGNDRLGTEFQEKGMVATEMFLTPHCTDVDSPDSYFSKQHSKRFPSQENNFLKLAANNVDTSHNKTNGVHDVHIIRNGQSEK